jgi:hypothetical protein
VITEVLGIIAPIAAAVNLTCLIIWLAGRRMTVTVIPSSADDYLSDILQTLEGIEREIHTRPYYNGEGVTYPYPTLTPEADRLASLSDAQLIQEAYDKGHP